MSGPPTPEDFERLQRLLVGTIGQVVELIVKVEALQILLEEQGVPRRRIEETFRALRTSWASDFQVQLAKTAEGEQRDALRRFLESYEGTKQ